MSQTHGAVRGLRNMTAAKIDTVVVGAGLGGLLAGALARHQGRSVVVLEQTNEPGGIGRSPALAEQPMNLGPRALYFGGASQRALKTLDIELPGFRPGAGSFLALEKGLVPMPTSPKSLLRASWLSWRERGELLLALRQVLGTPPLGSCGDWLSSLRSPRVRAFCAMLIRLTTYTHAPHLLSAALAFRAVKQSLDTKNGGVLYLDGGWHSLVEALRQRVTVRTATRVVQVSANGLVTLESGEQLQGDEVLLALTLRCITPSTAALR